MPVAVITGAAQGIGAGIAEVLAYNGLTVALVDIQRDKLMDVRNKIIENGGVNLYTFARAFYNF